MPITKQRILQAGVITLAITMLGGYVVYSQRAQQPQQAASSKSKQVIVGAGTSTNVTPESGRVMLGSSKGGLAIAGPSSGTVLTSGVIFLSGSGTSSVVTWPASATNPSQSGSPQIIMGSSKFSTVVKTDSLISPPAQSRPTGAVPALMMTGSKSAAVVRPEDLRTLAVTATGRVSTTLMPGSKSFIISSPIAPITTNSPP